MLLVAAAGGRLQLGKRIYIAGFLHRLEHQNVPTSFQGLMWWRKCRRTPSTSLGTAAIIPSRDEMIWLICFIVVVEEPFTVPMDAM